MSNKTRNLKIELSGFEREELLKAVINAYPEQSDLEQVINFKLEENLNVIAGGKNYKDVVFNLIKWAESTGKLDNFIEAISNERVENQQLKAIKDKLLVKFSSIAYVNTPPIKLEPNLLQRKPGIFIPWGILLKALMSSSSLTLLVIIIRLFSGIFEPSELWFYDQMMRFEFKEQSDDRLLLVEVTKEDIQKYSRPQPNQQGSDENVPKFSASLPDKIINQLLGNLLDKEVQVIGIDIYRDFSAYDTNLEKLFKDPKKINRLIFICKIPDIGSDNQGYEPPPDVPEEQVGFSDLLVDDDGVLRRQLLRMKAIKDKNSKCGTSEKSEMMDSFALKIAKKYLELTEKRKFLVQNKAGLLAYDGIPLKLLDVAKEGGYNLKHENFNGDQILLRYRNVQNPNDSLFASPTKDSTLNIAKKVSVSDILENKIRKDSIKNKIVLIGVPSESFDSNTPTPFSAGKVDAPMWGFYIQAQKVSQIVSAALDTPPRHLLTVFPLEFEMLWIIIWGIFGGILAQLYREPTKLITIATFCILLLYISCLGLFILPTMIWMPFTPTVVVYLGSGLFFFLRNIQSQNN